MSFYYKDVSVAASCIWELEYDNPPFAALASDMMKLSQIAHNSDDHYVILDHETILSLNGLRQQYINRMATEPTRTKWDRKWKHAIVSIRKVIMNAQC
jgi:hypothetical protein